MLKKKKKMMMMMMMIMRRRRRMRCFAPLRSKALQTNTAQCIQVCKT
jgi:hypothetical protein